MFPLHYFCMSFCKRCQLLCFPLHQMMMMMMLMKSLIHGRKVTTLRLITQLFLNYVFPYINPLHTNISMHILHTVLFTFSEMLTRGIFLKIHSFKS